MQVNDTHGQIAGGFQAGGVNQPAAGRLADVLSSIKQQGQKSITKQMVFGQVGLSEYIDDALRASNPVAGGGFKASQPISDKLIAE